MREKVNADSPDCYLVPASLVPGMGMVVLLVLWLAASCGVLSKPCRDTREGKDFVINLSSFAVANLCREKVEVFVLDQGIVSVGLR